MCHDTIPASPETAVPEAAHNDAASRLASAIPEFAPVPIRMANTMIDRMAAAGACTIRDLLEADFTSAEIIEYQAEARSIAMGRAVRLLGSDLADPALDAA